MKSCVYTGTVQHNRLTPKPHAFRYRLFMMYLDLDELPGLFDRFWCWSARRPAFAWFRRADYLGDRSQPLDEAVRSLIREQTGGETTGPIRMLTHLRYFGYVMNPVTFYYVSNADDTCLDFIVAEITNTPWGERHAYVMRCTPGSTESQTFTMSKEFHVSPFMDMNHEYQWTFAPPGHRLHVHMENYVASKRVFSATLSLVRKEISSRSLAAALLRHPIMTARVTAGIYWQAVRLWIKRTPFFTHPAKRPS